MAEPLIMVVDTNNAEREAMSQQLSNEGYEVKGVSSLEELQLALKGKQKYALILIDLSGFDQHIWGICDTIREAKIPFIIIAPQRSPAVQRDSIKCGASGLFVKPLSAKDLLEYIRTVNGQ